MIKPHRPYTLEEYNPSWKERFLNSSSKLEHLLGDNLVEIDHSGSTSIDAEGMIAKPQIDILVVVKDLGRMGDFRDDLVEAGFTIHGLGYVNDDDYYVSESDLEESRLTSVHILQVGNPKIKEYKDFRDYLKTNTKDRELYIKTKKELYNQHSNNYADYDRGKRDVIQAIKLRAYEWANG